VSSQPGSFTGQLQAKAKGSSSILIMTAAGAIGGVIGFFMSEVIQGGDTARFFAESLVWSTAVWFMLIVLGIGIALSASQGVIEKNQEKSGVNILFATPILIVGGIAAGAIAQKIYESMLDPSLDGPQVFPRAIGWAIAGLGAGVAVGLGFRSLTRTRNGALGGLGGGFIGGLLFDAIGSGGSAANARFIGIVLIGTLMGLLIGLLDVASTDYYLEITNGEFRGRQFVLFDQSSIIGCARTVPVTIMKDPLVTEQHVRVTKNSGGLAFECLKGAQPVLINGQSSTVGTLSVGGSLQVGNTVLVLNRRKGGSVQTGAHQNFAASATQQPHFDPVHQSPVAQQPPAARPRPTIPMQNKPKQ